MRSACHLPKNSIPTVCLVYAYTVLYLYQAFQLGPHLVVNCVDDLLGVDVQLRHYFGCDIDIQALNVVNDLVVLAFNNDR